MKKMKKVLAAAVAVLMCVGLVACGTSEFDAAGYTKSALDANYHGEYAEYAEFRGISEDEAKAEVEDAMLEQVNAELSGYDASEEGVQQCVDAFNALYALAKYEVVGAEKQDDDSFVVTLSIEPCSVYDNFESNVETITLAKMDEGLDPMSGDVLPVIIAEALQMGVEANAYGEAVEIQINVTPDSDGAYGIGDSDMGLIEDTMFPGL